jgi:hypothetical protein
MSRSPSHLVVWPNSTSNAFPVGGITVPSGRVISPVKGPGGPGDDGDPVAAAELDRVRVAVHVHVGEDAQHLLHRRGVRFLSVDRLGEPGDIRDHVRVVDSVHCGEVAGVERVVALLHEREQVRGPAGAVGRGSHESS